MCSSDLDGGTIVCAAGLRRDDGTGERGVTVWSPEGRLLHQRFSPVPQVNSASLALHPGGKVIASGGWSGSIDPWDLSGASTPKAIPAKALRALDNRPSFEEEMVWAEEVASAAECRGRVVSRINIEPAKGVQRVLLQAVALAKLIGAARVDVDRPLAEER